MYSEFNTLYCWRKSSTFMSRIFVVFIRHCYVFHFTILHSAYPCNYFFYLLFLFCFLMLYIFLYSMYVHIYLLFYPNPSLQIFFTMNLIVHQAVHLRSFCCTNCSIAAFSSSSDLKRKSYAY